jgi:uncharacterized protein with NRDE domain
VCLLIAFTRTLPDSPLVVAANRDERLDRPATAMTVLDAGPPRILGGRDELAGGTWLAVNDRGVVAGLTNRPVEAGRDPTKRSRGELPLLLARATSAEAAVAALEAEVDPSDYNPAWILVGDRRSLFAADVSDGQSLGVEELRPGLHILENTPFGDDSPKIRHVAELLAGTERLAADERSRRLVSVLSDHAVPAHAPKDTAGGPLPASVLADCVHGEGYGTRWSCLVDVGADDRPPHVRYAEGPPCRAPFVDADALWSSAEN